VSDLPTSGSRLLPSLLSGLGGHSLAFAERHLAELQALESPDLALWTELAELVSAQTWRDKEGILLPALEGLACLSEHPDLREPVHEAVRVFMAHSAHLAGAYLAQLCYLASMDRETAVEVTDYALRIASKANLAETFLEYAPLVLAGRNLAFLRTWHAEAVALAGADWWAAHGFLQSVAQSAPSLQPRDLAALAQIGSRIAERSRQATKGFFQMLPALLGTLSVAQIREWAEEGLAAGLPDEGLVLYMSYNSKKSHEVVQAFSRGTSFSALQPRVSVVLEAFLGRPVEVRSMFDLLEPTSVPSEVAALNDSRTLYLRPTLGARGLSPARMYKLTGIHAAAHQRFGSFEGRSLVRQLLGNGSGELDTPGATSEEAAVRRFLLMASEDYRIDAALFEVLPGLRQDAELLLRQVYADYLQRPGRREPVTPPALRAQLAVLPFGIRILENEALLAKIEEVMRPLTEEGASPAQSFSASARLFELIAPEWFAYGRLRDFAFAEVPYPPFHDHFSAGLALAGAGATGVGDEPAAAAVPAGERYSPPPSLDPNDAGLIESLNASDSGMTEPLQVSDMPEGEVPLGDLPDSRCDLVILEQEPGEELLPECEVYHYDEWDHEANDYRIRWCTVRCRQIPEGDSSFVQRTLEQYRGEVLLIRRQFERLRRERIARYFRQPDGDELDLDALVEALADRAAGAPLTDKVFIRHDKKLRDFAVLFLLDMSDSTEAPVEDDRRVIDVEKQGLVLLAQAVEQLDDRYAILGFTSQGRHRVDLRVIKDFEDEFDENVARRIGAIEPHAYTRLGAALRHAADRLSRQPAHDKLLILLSDGRPYDMGYGNMTYATEDVRMALYEARNKGLATFCITVDPEGPDYLRELFGAARYTVIQNVASLPTKLPGIYGNLTA
jgi:Mg-chelatase subunit ChlD